MESIRWLEMMSKYNGVEIRHALNGGEFKVPHTPYSADGYDKSSMTIYSYHGCRYHGCPHCFPDRDKRCHGEDSNISAQLSYSRTMDRERHLVDLGYRVITFWSHEVADLSDEKRDFMRLLDIQPRLDARSAFYGGRTNCVRLYDRTTSEKEQIVYRDFTSLYPWVNNYGRYPVGHPDIITSNIDVTLESYYGLALVRILPPRELYHPVLPHVANGKLTFTLCGTCADRQAPECKCTDEKRSIIGCWCTPEIAKAVEKGYRILKVYEVYHWKETTTSLFRDYVNSWLKEKPTS